MSTWNKMRGDRIQVALESVLLKLFSAPEAVLERRIIQTAEFRKNVLTVWAEHCQTNKKRYTASTISELARSKIPSGIDEDSKWVLDKMRTTADNREQSPRFPKELSMTGPRFPFEPKELTYLQRKTDTLTGRELTKPIQIGSKGQPEGKSSRRSKQSKDAESLEEYRWRVQDDDDNLNEDLLAPRYTSF